MIVKTLIIASIILNNLGLANQARRFDDAVIRNQYNGKSVALAESIESFLPELSVRPKVKSDAVKALINARHYILVDLDSNKVLLKEAAKDRVPIASTTKIMTAIIVLEQYKLDDIVTISAAAANQPGASANFRIGEQMSVRNLLKAMLIKSANGAAFALAEHMNDIDSKGVVKGVSASSFSINQTDKNRTESEEDVPSESEINSALSDKSSISKFLDAMNLKAKELGMKDTEYHDPAGLDTSGYSSAYDLFLATKLALTYPVFAEIVKTPEETVYNIDRTIAHNLKNSNRLIAEYQYLGAIGIKTGYMPEAGHVLVSAAKRDGHTLVGVIINTFADTAPASADESKKLLDWGWTNVKWN